MPSDDPDAARDQGARPRGAVRLGELERAVDPAVDQLAAGAAPPHAGAQRGLEGQVASAAARTSGSGQLDGAVHRVEERWPSNLSALARPIACQSELRRLVGPELERAFEDDQRVVEVVAAIASAAARWIHATACSRSCSSPRPADPGERRVLRAHRLVVVVGEQRGVLVAAVAQPLEPGGEARVQLGAARRGTLA